MLGPTVNGPASAAERRVALVIGNAAYTERQLRTPENDAFDVAAVLTVLDFDVVQLKNTKAAELRPAFDRFLAKASGADVALVYYSGAITRFRGQTHLLSVDGKMDDADTFRAENPALGDMLRQLDQVTRLKLVLLDACRLGDWFQTAPLNIAAGADPEPAQTCDQPADAMPANSFLSFAREKTLDALDANPRNSPFSAALIRHAFDANVDIATLAGEIEAELGRGAKASTRIGIVTTLQQPFQLAPNRGIVEPPPAPVAKVDPPAPRDIPPAPATPVVAAPKIATPQAADETARADFAIAQRINTRDVWESFLKHHPDGFLADSARKILQILPLETEEEKRREAALAAEPTPNRAPSPVTRAPEPPLPGVGAEKQATVVAAVPTVAPGIEVVRAFYKALETGNGKLAASYIIAAKRTHGPFSAHELSEFYGSLIEPLKLTGVEGTTSPFVARYQFRDRRKRLCDGHAEVSLDEVGGRYFIARIKALNGC